MSLPSVDENIQEAMKVHDRDVRASARKAGRTHDIAMIPARQKRMREEHAAAAVRRRLRSKSAPEALFKA